MPVKIDQFVNAIPDPQTRRAVRELAKALVAEIENHKDVFDAHTHSHDGVAFTSQPATDAAGNAAGTRAVFRSPDIS
jgi:hypothetical protein